MIFSQKQGIDELIIRELSHSPHLELKELIKKISPKLKKKISLQAWYKIIKKLLDQGVIIKQNKKYTLNVSWLAQVIKWANMLKTIYVERARDKIIKLPKKQKEKVKFTFPDLLSLNAFWAHILVHLGSLTPEGSTVYAYNPHFWFYLAHGDFEKQYNQSMKDYKVKTQIIIGSNTFLDQWNAKFFDSKIIEHWLSPKPLYPDQKKYINYLNGYYLEIKLEKQMAEKIDKLFKKTESLADISQLELLALFSEKSICTMMVSCNKQKGEAFARKIKRHF